ALALAGLEATEGRTPVVGGALADLVLVEHALEVGAGGLGVEVGAVVELHALAELEGPVQAGVVGLPGLRELGLEVGGSGGDADQVLEDLAADPEGLAVTGVEGVERDRGPGSAEREDR